MGNRESNLKRVTHSITGLSQTNKQKKAGKRSNKLTSHLKELEKEQQTKPKVI